MSAVMRLVDSRRPRRDAREGRGQVKIRRDDSGIYVRIGCLAWKGTDPKDVTK